MIPWDREGGLARRGRGALYRSRALEVIFTIAPPWLPYVVMGPIAIVSLGGAASLAWARAITLFSIGAHVWVTRWSPNPAAPWRAPHERFLLAVAAGIAAHLAHVVLTASARAWLHEDARPERRHRSRARPVRARVNPSNRSKGQARARPDKESS